MMYKMKGKGVKNHVKKGILKKILVKGKFSPKLDNGLGNTPVTGPDVTGGGGSNLGTTGVF